MTFTISLFPPLLIDLVAASLTSEQPWMRFKVTDWPYIRLSHLHHKKTHRAGIALGYTVFPHKRINLVILLPEGKARVTAEIENLSLPSP